MKKKSLSFILFLIASLWMSCNDMPKSASEEQKAFVPFTSVTSIPDSLLTPEQKVLKRKLGDVFYKIIVPQGNKLIVTIDKDSFLQLGLPEEYYDMLVRNIDNANNYTDTTGIDFIQSFLKSKKEYFESIDSE